MGGWLPERRQVIQQQLRELQARWERFLAQLNDTRAVVEASVGQWQEAKESCEQVLRWLKDTERRMADAELRSDLTEKRVLLQKIKVINFSIIFLYICIMVSVDEHNCISL